MNASPLARACAVLGLAGLSTSCASQGRHDLSLELDGATDPSLDAGLEGGDPGSPDAGAVAEGSSPGEGGADAGAPTATPCAKLPLCDDFEADTPGMPPSPASWSLRNGCSNTPDLPGAGPAISIDSSVSHSGKNSVHVAGGDSCGYYFVNTGAFAKLPGQVYARFWARFSGPATAGHNGFVSLHVDGAMDQLRLGFQGGVMAWNYFGPDTTLPDIDPMGEVQSAATHPDQWDCIEFHLDPSNGHIEFWLNELAVPGLSYSGASTQGVNDQWHTSGPTSLAISDFGLGWLRLNDAYTAWFDDVALGGARIGCR